MVMSKWLAPQCPLVVCATSVQDPLKLAAVAEEETADMLAAAKAPARTKTRMRDRPWPPLCLPAAHNTKNRNLFHPLLDGPLNRRRRHAEDFRLQYDNANTGLGRAR
jgi:hypothetical protein